MLLGDFHTHSTLDDGKDTLEEMAAEAYAMGLTHFGFSGHSFEECGQDFCMSRANVPVYLEIARKLREEYRGKMEVFVGLELDYFGEKPEGLDYTIGSVHGIRLGEGQCHYVDVSAETSRQIVDEHFGGDWYRYADAYYDLVADLPGKTGCQWIGHFDLVTKFNEQVQTIDEASPRYLKRALEVLEHVVRQGVALEINTGAMARDYRTVPYPNPILLRKLKEFGGEIVINSDCHHAPQLCYGFDRAVKLAQEAGFTHTNLWTKDGLRPVGWDEFGKGRSNEGYELLLDRCNSKRY